MSKRKQFNPSPVTFLNNNFEREKGDYNFIILWKRMCIHTISAVTTRLRHDKQRKQERFEAKKN